MEKIKLGLYRHYKGKEYKVPHEAMHSETEEVVIVYQCLYGDYGDYGYWVRPKEMFMGTVDIEGKTVPRFEFISES